MWDSGGVCGSACVRVLLCALMRFSAFVFVVCVVVHVCVCECVFVCACVGRITAWLLKPRL